MTHTNAEVAAANRMAKPHLNRTITHDGEEFSFWSMAPAKGVWFTNGKRFLWVSEKDENRRSEHYPTMMDLTLGMRVHLATPPSDRKQITIDAVRRLPRHMEMLVDYRP